MAGMVVKNNMSATNTLNTLNKNHSALQKSLQKVSSGLRITSAGDDSSGYAIAERMAVQMRSLDQDNKNAQNGNSMLKVAEGAVANTVEIISTLKEKVLNAANDTNTDSDRAQIQKELDQMVDQIDDNANVTYNGKYLVDGSHNREIKVATYTHFTNSSFAEYLSDGTEVDDQVALTDMEDRTGRSLGIQEDDFIQFFYVMDGVTHPSTQVQVEDKSLYDLLRVIPEITIANTDAKIGVDASGNDLYTPDYKRAITYKATASGLDGQISGFTFCVTDKGGNVNKSANAILDNFEETIRAENTSPDNSIVLQIGTKANQAIKVGLSDMRSYALGLKGKDGTVLNISTQKNANAAINVLDIALQKCLNQQTTIGSIESRLEYTSANIVTGSENTQASMSTMRDADMAAEMTEYTKNNVLLQAAQSMLAQANQNSSSVLSLLQ